MQPGDDARPAWAWLVAVLLIHIWLWPHWPLLQPPDDWSRLDLVRALVEDRSVSVDRQVERFGPVAALARHEGRWYSDKALGHPLVAALAYLPVYAALGDAASQPLLLHLLSVLTLALPTGLVAAGLVLELRPKIGSCAHVAAAAYAFGSPALPYTAMFYGHQIAGAWLFLAWLLIVRGRSGWAGLALGMAVITEFPVAAPAAVLGVWALLRATGLAAQARAIGGALLPAGLHALYNAAAFGSPWRLAYAYKTDPVEIAVHSAGLFGITLLPRLDGLYGLLLGPSKGLLYYAPATALCLLAPLARKGPRIEGRSAILLAVLSLVLLLSSFTSWPGGLSTGPRMLLPVLPLLTLLLGGWGERLPRKTLALLTGAGLVHSGLPTLTFPLLPPESADPVPQFAANLLWRGVTTFTLGGFWMPIWVGAAVLALGVGVSVFVLAGSRRAALVGLGAAAAFALVEGRRIDPALDPGLGLMLSRDLFYTGHPRLAAELAESVLQNFKLPPELARRTREEALRCRLGKAPPPWPELLAPVAADPPGP
jgi:hypothetical protein